MKRLLATLLIVGSLAGSACAATATSTSAPPEATYITQTANAALASSQALSALSTGPLFVTTSTGVLSTATSLPITGGTVTASTPLLNATQTWNNSGVTFTGLKQVITNTASGGSSLLADFQVGATSVFNVATDGTISSRAALNLQNGSALTAQLSGASGLFMASDFSIGWNSVASGGGSLFANGSKDTILLRDAANTLALRNSTNAQAFNLYNTYTDATHFERLREKWSSNVCYLGPEQTGGTDRTLVIDGAATKNLTESTATAFVRIAVPSNGPVGGVIHYSIVADDGTDYQERTGSVNFSAVGQSANTTSALGTVINESVATSTGTLTVSFSTANNTGSVDIKANAVSSLTQTTLAIKYRVEIFGAAATVTPQ